MQKTDRLAESVFTNIKKVNYCEYVGNHLALNFTVEVKESEKNSSYEVIFRENEVKNRLLKSHPTLQVTAVTHIEYYSLYLLTVPRPFDLH